MLEFIKFAVGRKKKETNKKKKTGVLDASNQEVKWKHNFT